MKINIFPEMDHYKLECDGIELRCDAGELNSAITEFETYYQEQTKKRGA